MDLRQIWTREIGSNFLDLNNWLLKDRGHTIAVSDAYSTSCKFTVNYIMMRTGPAISLPVAAIPLAAAETWDEGFGEGETIGTYPGDPLSADRIRTMRDEWGPIRQWLYWDVYRRWVPEPNPQPAPWQGTPAESSLSTFAVSMTRSADPMLVLASDFRVTPEEVVFFVRMLDGERRYDYDHVRVSRNVINHDDDGAPIVEVVPESEEQERWAYAQLCE